MSRNLLHIIPSVSWSGIERHTLDICTEFMARGWNVTVLSKGSRSIDERFRENEVRIIHAPLMGAHDYSTVMRLRRYLRELQEDEGVVIHVHRYRDALCALMARKLANRPDVRIIMTHHFVRPGKRSFLHRLAYRKADCHIFVSRQSEQSFLTAFREDENPFGSAESLVLHNSLRLPPEPRVEEPERGPVTGMFHGRLAPGKGLETLIDALTMTNARFRVRIVGSGRPEYVDRLRQRAIAKGVMEKIDWRRHTPDPLPSIRETHFGVLPSTEPEGFGLSNLEYMAMGRPQICTFTGAQGEYLTDGETAFAVTPANAASLAAKMDLLATDRELRVRMGKEAWTQFQERMSWKGFADQLEARYLGASLGLAPE